MSEDDDEGRTVRRARRRPTRGGVDDRTEEGCTEHTPQPVGDQGTTRSRLALGAARDLADALGWEWEALIGLRRGSDSWTVTMDVVETHRVPSTTDVIAVYDIEVDGEGELLGYHRKRHYIRGRGDNDRPDS
jgi:hypothetical protein